MPEAPGERRYYTVAEANASLPEVRRLLADLRRAVGGLESLKARLVKKSDSEEGGDELPRPEPDSPVEREHFLLVHHFHQALARFQELGIEVKDVQKGLVDFPALLEGEEVRLCWLEGEEAVLHYHDLESGFSGRRPIEQFTPPPKEEEPEEEG